VTRLDQALLNSIIKSYTIDCKGKDHRQNGC